MSAHTVAVRVHVNPLLATPQMTEDLLWTKATNAAAKRGREPVWPPSATASTETSDGYEQIDATFETDEVSR